MSRRRLTDSVSVDELLKMRESGMTNSDIARALDVSYHTVLHYIGNQPGRAARHAYTPKPVKSHCKSLGGGNGMSESAPACLAVSGRIVSLEGICGSYMVDAINSTITIDTGWCEKSIDMPADKLPDFINELSAIMRHIPELSKCNEMW